MKYFTLRLALFLSGILLALIITEIMLRVFMPEKTLSKLVGPYTFQCYEKGAYSYVQLKKIKIVRLSLTIRPFRITQLQQIISASETKRSLSKNRQEPKEFSSLATHSPWVSG